MLKKEGFIFIETIIVICILTIALMSLYNNYSKIITNTRELNTFDTTEYNYKTYFLKEIYDGNRGKYGYSDNYYQIHDSDLEDGGGNIESGKLSYYLNECKKISTTLPENAASNPDLKITDATKICFLKDITTLTNYNSIKNIDAYIIDYLASQDLNSKNDSLFLVEYKKADKTNSGEYLTYISSLTF